MQDIIRDYLKEDKKLLQAYEKSEAKYLLSMKEYETFNVNINLEEESFKEFIKALAKYNLCLDQWISHQILDLLIQKEMEKKDEKTGKHSENLED